MNTQKHRIALNLLISQAIQKHGAMTIYEAAGEADRGSNYDPLRNLGLTVESFSDVSQISLATFLALSEEEKQQTAWESNQRFLKRWRTEVLESGNKDRLAEIDHSLALSPEELSAEGHAERHSKKIWICH